MVMSKRIRGIDRLPTRTEVNDERISEAVHMHDRVVSDVEKRWGVDRLQELVSENTRAKFHQQREKLWNALTKNDGRDAIHQAEVMCRAYQVLEREAKELGCKELTGDYIEGVMPDGKVLAITSDKFEAGKVARDNREMCVYSIEEIGRILHAKDKKVAAKVHEQVDKVKSIFAGAEVVSVKSLEDIDDEIPF
jgi:hypothetical protein